MNKSIFVLIASGALVSAASAQTSITVYGQADAAVVGESGGPAGSLTKVTSGAAYGSRLGFKGTEDLGGGLAAMYVLESGINIDNGSSGQGGLLFGRQAFVGLSSELGSLKLGRQYTPLDIMIFTADPFSNGTAGRAQNVFTQGYLPRFNNGVVYSTPNWHGVTADLSYGFGETPGNSAANRYTAASLGYARGKIYARLAHQKSNDASATGSVRNTVLVGMVDFGPARLHLGYSVNKRSTLGLTTFDSNDVMVGVQVPYGAGKFIVSYAHKNDKLAVDKDASQSAIGYVHNLSKRTMLYAAYARIRNKNGAAYTVGNATEAGSGNAGRNLGIRHVF